METDALFLFPLPLLAWVLEAQWRYSKETFSCMSELPVTATQNDLNKEHLLSHKTRSPEGKQLLNWLI